jgi:predicted ATPase
VLGRLQAWGYAVVPEVARAIIADRKARGQSPRPPPREFAQAVFARDVEQYQAASTDHVVFFDRSILDSLGMLASANALSDSEQRDVVARYPYHPTAFILPPWREIYRMDAERDQSFEHAVQVHTSLHDWYVRHGYTLVEVPTGPIDRRCEFMLQTLGISRDDNP